MEGLTKSEEYHVDISSFDEDLPGQEISETGGLSVNIRFKLTWSPVPGAVGYVVYRASGTDGTFVWPANFVTTQVETTYLDKGYVEKNVKGQTARCQHRLFLSGNDRECWWRFASGNLIGAAVMVQLELEENG